MYVLIYVIDVGMYLRNGERGTMVVEALCYKPEGRGFEIR
jgi:hypothetical protein